MSSVEQIYNELFQYESKNDSPYPIHKNLRFSSGGLLDFIASNVQFRNKDHVFDAGCGNGYSLFWLNGKFGCSGEGRSLSRNEIAFAKAHVKKLEKEDVISFHYGNYDEQQVSMFDKVIAIESLKHSNDLKTSIMMLMKNLTDGGQFIVADDFVRNESKNLRAQRKLWQSSSFVSFEHFRDSIEPNCSIHTFNLTDLVPVRSKLLLQLLITSVRFIRMFTPRSRTNIDTYLGGLILEFEYKKKNVDYLLLIISKDESKKTHKLNA